MLRLLPPPPPLSALTGRRLRHCVMLYARYPTRRRKAGVIFRQGQRYSMMGSMLGYNQVCEDKLVWRLHLACYLNIKWRFDWRVQQSFAVWAPVRYSPGYHSAQHARTVLEVSVSSPNRPLLAPDWRACYLVIPTLSPNPRVSRKST